MDVLSDAVIVGAVLIAICMCQKSLLHEYLTMSVRMPVVSGAFPF